MPIVSQRGLDERAALFPPDVLPLFDDAFVRSCDLIEEYSVRLAIEIARETGVEHAMASGGSAEEIVARARLDPRVALGPVTWLLGILASRGLRPPLPRLAPREIEAQQETHDPRCLPSYRIAAAAAAHYPAVLRGETSGEQALFSADRMEAWAEYFSNDNPVYAISNSIAALAASRAFPENGGAILELGGGFGSGAEALLTQLEQDGRLGGVRAYRFSDVSIPFLRRAQRSLPQRFPAAPLVFAKLDMNRPFAEGGVEPGAYTVVHAVNAVHAASDLSFTLAEIRRALVPGGTLVAGECVRPFAGQPIYVELVFNLLEAYRRPGGGFLTPEQWTAALAAAGFRGIRLEPDVVALRDLYPSFIITAVTAHSA